MTHEPESVWDYPRPPALRGTNEAVEVHFGGQIIARTDKPIQVLETSHPPTYYLPRTAFEPGVLKPVPGRTTCEFKGQASYFDVVVGEARASRAAWRYPEPTSGFADLLGHVALMPGLMDAIYVDGELVQAQDGDFYGGWITSKIKGPFKGAPGTLGW
ncbi:DUF427 domain-containing protein [Ornithinimicrobium sp. INDO-MA30-4]|uniref:DUF427 domain-containing protein n=1 Tax=Ornithinimicrobium sp. INDO-MA30-4 TaxID=2908651 RepID=UPI001F264B0C|nr:DUF427 domain-containing protein [Ornithinimicrobium sp. INDO-MA30-4]UJH70341.1 DUF427 domain-containing protein [Ornithinimicrobium sp. INDO-MA30-4]